MEERDRFVAYLMHIGYKGKLISAYDTVGYYTQKHKGLLFEVAIDERSEVYCTLRVIDTKKKEVLGTFNIHFAKWQDELSEINEIDWERA